MKKIEMQVEYLQPWSTFVMKTQLPQSIFQKMLKITDEIVANVESAEDFGEHLAGQIEQEFLISHKILDRENLTSFFCDIVRQFVINQTLQTAYAFEDKTKEEILEDEWITKITEMWVISQKDNEYNPIHHHYECAVASVMYLKIPEYLPSRKSHRNDDGAINFTSNSAQDQYWGNSSMTIRPAVGDFFIFPASLNHFVYPFRTADGKGERRCVSFNAEFANKSKRFENV